MTPPANSSVPMTLGWAGWTDVGRVRKNNEDAFLALQFDAREVRRLGKVGEATTENADFAFAVSDGMGGALAGEYASRIAVEKITTLLPRSFHLSAKGLNAGVNDVLVELFDQIHRALVYVGGSYEECAGMATTLSLGWFTPGWLYFAHVGDSRAYLLRGGALRQITDDHSLVGEQVRLGLAQDLFRRALAARVRISLDQRRRHLVRLAGNQFRGGRKLGFVIPGAAASMVYEVPDSMRRQYDAWAGDPDGHWRRKSRAKASTS